MPTLKDFQNAIDALIDRKDYSAAIRTYKSADRAFPNNRDLLWSMAMLAGKLEDHVSAEYAYGKLLAIEPVHHAVYFNAAKVKRGVGKYSESVWLFRLFLSTIPDKEKDPEIRWSARVLMVDCISKAFKSCPGYEEDHGKYYAEGKARVTYTYPKEPRDLFLIALNRAIMINVEINREKFKEELTPAGLSKELVDDLLDGIMLSDDTYLVEHKYE